MFHSCECPPEDVSQSPAPLLVRGFFVSNPSPAALHAAGEDKPAPAARVR